MISEDILVEKNETAPAISERQSQLLSNGEEPVVRKFMHNIYSEQFFSQSALRDYIDQFYIGY